MAPFSSWNNIEDDDEDDLQGGAFEGKKDVILFCIDASPSMQELYDDPNYENVKTCHLFTALEAAVQIQKKKVLVGPNDSVGILLYNTVKNSPVESTRSAGTFALKPHTFSYQAITTINAPTIKDLMQILDEARDDHEKLQREFPPLTDRKVPMGDVFTSCNWALRDRKDGKSATASQRIFLITDEDDPHAGKGKEQLNTSAHTTFLDLTQAGITVEPFFISSEGKPFDLKKFYADILGPTNNDDDVDPSMLPESISISRIEDLLSQMRFHEVPKRSLFNIPFQLAEGFTIGVKGYGLVTEQKKGIPKYFKEEAHESILAMTKTSYVDEEMELETMKDDILYGMSLGKSDDGALTRTAANDSRPFYTADEVKAFRTLGLEPGLKLLGFKDRSELRFEDNIKHSQFIYPDEGLFSGSKRTFAALLQSMLSKNKIGLVLALNRRNSTPIFCALLPQAEKVEDGGWNEPPGIHLIPLPFADDIRAAKADKMAKASDALVSSARKWISKIAVKNGTYPPDSYPNPVLAFHNEQLQASAFREIYDPDQFEDLTYPKYDTIHKRAGKLIKEFNEEILEDPAARTINVVQTGTKRKAVEEVDVDDDEFRAKFLTGTLNKFTNDRLKAFLKSKHLPVAGKKADFVERVDDWFTKNPA